MSRRFATADPRRLAGGPAAVQALHAALAGEATLAVAETWMLAALPPGAAPQAAGDRHCTLDPYAPPACAAWNEALARSLAEERGLRVVKAPEAGFGRGDARPGLCLEARTLAARLAARYGRRLPERALLLGVLPALGPAGLSGAGAPWDEDAALAALEAGAAFAGLPRHETLELPPGREIPKRPPRMGGAGAGLRWSWRRAAGLCWHFEGLRECAEVASLEVQEDLGGGGPFQAGAPPRPRLFLAGHMQPEHWVEGAEVSGFRLVREIRLPRPPGEPGGPWARMRWSLSLLSERATDRLRLLVELTAPVAGQRYRLRLPFPRWPRPVRWDEPAGTAHVERSREGPVPLAGACTRVRLDQGEAAVEVGGAGLWEFEVLPYKNDLVLALTLLRARKDRRPPARISRLFEVRLV